MWVAGGAVGFAERLDVKQVAHARAALASVALGEKAGVTDAVDPREVAPGVERHPTPAQEEVNQPEKSIGAGSHGTKMSPKQSAL
jgi:hypothetical protein